MDNARDMRLRGARGNERSGRVVAVLLAAGASTRFGRENKLLADLGGEPLVARVAGALLDSRIAEVVAVTPADPSGILAALERHRGAHPSRLRLVANPDPSRGISSSIAAGIDAVPLAASGAMIVPGDMPGLEGSTCDALISAFAASDHAAVVHAATQDGAQRNPVIWPRRLFASLMALEGDSGGKRLISAERATPAGRVIAVPFAAPELFLDVDEPDDLARWR